MFRKIIIILFSLVLMLTSWHKSEAYAEEPAGSDAAEEVLTAEEAAREDTGEVNEPQYTVPAEGFYSDETEFSMKPGESRQLQWRVYPDNADETPVFSLEYADENCISVTEDGLVTALNYGSGQVVGRLANGFSVYYNVYVSDDPVSLYFDERHIAVVGQTFGLFMNYSPWEAHNCRLHITSSNPEVLAVSNEWEHSSYIYFIPVSEGKATITATADNGVSCSTEITVIKGNYAEYINRENWDNIYVLIGEKKQLEYTLSSADGSSDFSDEKVQWEVIDGKSAVSVDENGVVTAVAPGTAYVQATITNLSLIHI